MNNVYVSTYVVKYEKLTEFQALVKHFLKFKKANPKAFEGLKSFRLFQQEYGGVVGSYVEMWEFRSKEEMEKVITGLMKRKEMKEIDTEFQKMVDHTTLTASIWNTVA
jgi:DNA polymerase sigma